MKMRNLIVLVTLLIAFSCTQMERTNPLTNDVKIVYDTICVYDTIEVTKVVEVATEPEPEFYIVMGDTIASDDMGQQGWNIYLSEESTRMEKEVELLNNALIKKHKRWISEDVDGKYREHHQKELRQYRLSQKLWKQFVEADFQFVGMRWEGGSGRASAMFAQKIGLMEDRIRDLEYWLDN